MTERKSKRALNKLPGKPEPAYEVGFGRPPKETRFKPGQSGNPRGRPKGAKSKTSLPSKNEERLKSVILGEAYRSIKVSEGGRNVEISVIQAVLRRLAVDAAKGNQRSQRMFTDLVQSVERDNKALHDQFMEDAIIYKSKWDLELARREKTGETGPDPLPHPDDIVINFQNGQVEIRGPMSKEDKAEWDDVRRGKRRYEEAMLDLEARAAEDPDDQSIRDELEKNQRLLARIEEVFPYLE